MKILLLLALLLLGAPKEGELEKTSLTCTLQGQSCSLSMRPYRVENGEYYATLVVLRPDGTVLWESPQVVDSNDELAFGAWNHGVSLPELVGDFDRDKQVELIAPQPVSDVSPVEFKVYRWIDGTFRPAYTRALLLGNDGKARWTVPKEGNQTWVSRFDGWQGDKILASFTSTQGKTGQALLTPDRGGFLVAKWVSPLK